MNLKISLFQLLANWIIVLSAITPAKDIVLASSTIYGQAVKASRSKYVTKLPQLDIIESLYKRYRNDPRMVSGGDNIIIKGYYFSRAFGKAGHLFKKDEKEKMLKSRIRPPEIKYSFFEAVRLSSYSGKRALSITLKKAYIQEIPYTFGAKFALQKNIKGTIRSGKKENITEVVFYSTEYVKFDPPGIAFFVPDIDVKLVSFVRKNGNTFGFVTGRRSGNRKKFVSVCYNLSTCAKSSMKTYNLTYSQYRKKLNNADYFGFVN
ncbi:MAG: hypothetical protein ACLFQK_07655 [Fibrobacterota bacterium]